MKFLENYKDVDGNHFVKGDDFTGDQELEDSLIGRGILPKKVSNTDANAEAEKAKLEAEAKAKEAAEMKAKLEAELSLEDVEAMDYKAMKSTVSTLELEVADQKTENLKAALITFVNRDK